MLAALLLHQMTSKNIKRRRNTAEKLAETPVKLDMKASQSDYCRTCLSTTNLRSIFCNAYDDHMSHKLKLITSCEIKRNDNLSQKICNKCLRIINNGLNFRARCKDAEKTLLGMFKNNVKKESESEIKIGDTKYPAADIRMKNIKIEFDDTGTDTFQNSVKMERFNDVSIHRVQDNESIKNENIKDEVHSFNNNTSKNIQNTDGESSWDSNVPVDDGDISKPVKMPPKTSAERQKKYRERLKLQNSELMKAIQLKNAKMTLQEQKKKIPPRSQRVRRPYTRHPHVPGPPYVCDKCGKQLPDRTAYVKHVRVHTSFVVCEECGKLFKSNFELQQHKRAKHGLAKIHKCAYCEYSSANKEGLTVHERRHTGERPYICDYCAVGFYTRRTLIQHIGVHLPDTIQCPHCPKRLKSERLLSNHKALRHGKRYSYQCPRCPKEFKSNRYARKHLSKFHHLAREEIPKIEKVLLYQYRKSLP